MLKIGSSSVPRVLFNRKQDRILRHDTYSNQHSGLSPLLRRDLYQCPLGEPFNRQSIWLGLKDDPKADTREGFSHKRSRVSNPQAALISHFI